MPNSSGADDHNFGAIEAAVKETARGRAFLADYARKVRQSDTLTMLAMIGRLERWCQDQAVRLAELEGRDLAFGGRASEVHASLALGLGEATEQMIGRGEVSLNANPDSASVDRTSDEEGREIASVPQSREAMDRIEHLANTFRDFDRRAGDLTRRYSAIGQFTDIRRSALVASADVELGTIIAHSAASDASGQFSPDTANKKTHPPEEDVLDDIAKALATVA
jgi:hypothetical protein